MSKTAHNSFYQTSDFIIFCSMFAGALIEYFFLWGSGLPVSMSIRIFVGVAAVSIGIGLVITSRLELKRANQPTEPGVPTTELVTTGIFSHTRNPLYLGLVILLAGLGLCLNYIAWIFLSAIAAIVIHFVLVIPEEEYLISKFGSEYQSYMSDVPRWM
jgi:protein-S-isoprenylcysteine O-methyltransferase Ste14